MVDQHAFLQHAGFGVAMQRWLSACFVCCGAAAAFAAQPVRLEGHVATPVGVGFLPDGRLASGSDSGALRLWDIEKRTSTRQEVGFGFGAAVASLRTDARGEVLAVVEDHGFLLWNATGAELAEWQQISDWTVSHHDMQPAVATDRYVAACLRNPTTGKGIIVLFDRATQAVVRKFEPAKYCTAFAPLLFTPDGERLVSSGDDGGVLLWTVESSERARLRAPEPYRGLVVDHAIRAMAFRDASTLVSYDGAGDLCDWRMPSESEPGAITPPMCRSLQNYSAFKVSALSPGAAFLAVGTAHGEVLVHDVPTGTLLAIYAAHIPHRITALTVAADGRVASGGADGVLYVYPPVSPQPTPSPPTPPPTPTPPTPAPPTALPPTPAPPSPSPPTLVPNTSAPPTATPNTSAPLSAAQHGRAVHQGFGVSPKAALRGAGSVAAAASLLSGAGVVHVGAVALLRSFRCDMNDVDLRCDAPPDFEFSPTGAAVGGGACRFMVGAVVINAVLFAAAAAGLFFAAWVWGRVRGGGELPVGLAAVRAPGVLWVPYAFLFPGTVVCSARLLSAQGQGGAVGVLVGAAGLLGCAVVPAVAHRLYYRGVARCAEILPDARLYPMTSSDADALDPLPSTGVRRAVYSFVYGHAVWVPRGKDGGWYCEYYGVVFEAFKEGHARARPAELAAIAVLCLLSVVNPAAHAACAARNISLTLVLFGMLVLVAWQRPYVAPADNVVAVGLAALMALASLLLTVAVASEAPQGGGAYAAAEWCLLLSVGLIVARAVVVVVGTVHDHATGRTAGARAEARGVHGMGDLSMLLAAGRVNMWHGGLAMPPPRSEIGGGRRGGAAPAPPLAPDLGDGCSDPLLIHRDPLLVNHIDPIHATRSDALDDDEELRDCTDTHRSSAHPWLNTVSSLLPHRQSLRTQTPVSQPRSPRSPPTSARYESPSRTVLAPARPRTGATLTGKDCARLVVDDPLSSHRSVASTALYL